MICVVSDAGDVGGFHGRSYIVGDSWCRRSLHYVYIYIYYSRTVLSPMRLSDHHHIALMAPDNSSRVFDDLLLRSPHAAAAGSITEYHRTALDVIRTRPDRGRGLSIEDVGSRTRSNGIFYEQ